MKNPYQLEALDCAPSAPLMEPGIRKIPGVTAVSVSFLTQKLPITADDGQFDEIMQEVRKTCKKIAPAATIRDYPENKPPRK